LSKITNLMRQAAIISGVTGALIIGAAATAHASVPAAQAPAVSSSTGVSQAAQTEDPPTTMSFSACTDTLSNFNYTVTRTRSGICFAAATAIFTAPSTRVAACSAGLFATGVSPLVSGIACTAAVFGP
jgi:hypothetical protein